MYIGLIIGTAIITLAAHKFIIYLIRQALVVLLAFGIIKISIFWYSLAPDALAAPLAGAIIGGVLGFGIVGVLCAAWIRHALIRFYLHEAIEKQKAAAKAGRLW